MPRREDTTRSSATSSPKAREIDAASPNGTTALMMAAREGRASTLDLLIARGADVNHRNETGASALDWAQRAKEPAMVDRLRRAGARS